MKIFNENEEYQEKYKEKKRDDFFEVLRVIKGEPSIKVSDGFTINQKNEESQMNIKPGTIDNRKNKICFTFMVLFTFM